MADWRFWRRRRAQDQDLNRELELHLALEAEDRMQNGASVRDAELAARRKFGSVALAKENVREEWPGAVFERLWQDADYALRLLRRNPGFTTVAVFTLALAVAANTAIFSVIEAVMLRPLAFRNSDELVAISRVIPNAPQTPGSLAAVHFAEWRKSAKSFANLSLVGGPQLSLTGTGEPETVPGARVSANLFDTLGITMQRGRTFLQEEEDRQETVAIVTDALWRRRFAADPQIIGRTIGINGAPFTVIGVLPAGFTFPPIARAGVPRRAEVWLPITPAPFELDPRSPVFNYGAVGRLNAGVHVAQATAELNSLQAALAKLSLNRREVPVSITPLRDQVASPYRAGLLLMWASVGSVLLISCANIANLMLARAARRSREMAVRKALGASRTRIVTQMLVESLVLSGISGLLGLFAAYGLIRMIVWVAPSDLPRIDEVHMDPRVLLFTLSVIIGDGLIFGVLPAWRSSRAHPQEAMRFDSRTATAGKDSARLRGALVSVEVALCALCLVAGGLLLQSFVRVLNVQRGFDIDQIITVTIGVPSTRYPGVKRAAFLQTALDRMRTTRAVNAVGLANVLPLTGDTGPGLSATVAGQQGEKPTIWLRAVNADYFTTLGIPLREGRLFRDEDAQRQVVVLSHQAARRLWPDESPIGKQLRIGPEISQLFKIAFEVIGVVGDAHAESLTSALPDTLYLPYWQDLSFTSNWSFAIKTTNPLEATREVRAILRSLDAEIPIPAFRSMDQILSGSVEQRRFQLMIVLVFAAAGLLLASIGLYGIVAYAIAQRTNEIGIRMALGARAASIRSLVVRQSLWPLVPGLLIGVLGSLGVERVVGSLLFGVSPRDPVTIAGVVFVLTAVGLAAAYFPARRATRINPVSALRYE